MKNKFLLLIIFACACACACAQDLRLYSDDMVLQQGAPLHFQGRAHAGERVKVALAGLSTEVRADSRGRWEAWLPALPAGGPYTLQMGSETYRRVYLGEVWLCSGQSNMEFTLSNDAEFRRHAAASDPNGPAPDGGDYLAQGTAHPRLHLFNMKARWLTMPPRWSDEALAEVDAFRYFDTSAGWTLCSEAEASRFSAIAYYFGRALADSLPDLHIGLVLNAVGGSPAESWASSQTLQSHHPDMLADWPNNPLVQDWVRKRGCENAGSDGHLHPYRPAYLYQAGLEPLSPFAFRGVIWYQGESNAQDVALHERLFPHMLADWRRTLRSPDGTLPFLMVQLSSIAPRLTWPEFRDSQRRLAESLSRTWMAISSDYGDSLDVHPRTKRPIGTRLAALALHGAYHRPQPAILPYAPTGWTLDKGRLTLDCAGQPLRFTKATPRMFEVQAPDGQWIEAQPLVLDGRARPQPSDRPGRLALQLPAGLRPVAVRYAWQPFTRANVTNAQGWPLSTFLLPLNTTR